MKDYRITARLQKGWNWMVAIYLFFGGVGSGAYVVGALAGFMGWPDIARVGIILSLPCVIIGTLFLLAHLGNPMRAYLAPSKIATSWISRGVVFISFFMLFSLIHILIITVGFLAGLTPLIAVLGVITAIGTMVYTGALLSAAKGVPFWESGIMPILFMFSALVTGLFAVLLVSYLAGIGEIAEEVAWKLALIGMGLLIGEAVILFFFLYSAYQLPDTRDSVTILLGKSSFIIGDLIIGLLIPFLLMLAVIGMKGSGSTPMLMMLGGLLALIGGIFMRFGIVSAGMRAPMNISGFEFKLQRRPEPRAPRGHVPPGNV